MLLHQCILMVVYEHANKLSIFKLFTSFPFFNLFLFVNKFLWEALMKIIRQLPVKVNFVFSQKQCNEKEFFFLKDSNQNKTKISFSISALIYFGVF